MKEVTKNLISGNFIESGVTQLTSFPRSAWEHFHAAGRGSGLRSHAERGNEINEIAGQKDSTA